VHLRLDGALVGERGRRFQAFAVMARFFVTDAFVVIFIIVLVMIVVMLSMTFTNGLPRTVG
jgi:hypothetical protein